ncbi:MAG: rhomboid family intramembrane serine protease [Nitrospirota bacterium]
MTTSDDYRPVAWMGRYPVDVTTMLVGVHIVCAILTSLAFAIGHSSLVNYLVFDSALIWSSGQVWRFFTYAFIHGPSTLFWFAVEMYMLFVFGREVERFLGRRAYIALYLFLLLTPPALLMIWGLWQHSGLSGSLAIHFGVFIAFATIYPRVELLLRIMAKWVALILAGVYTFQLLAYNAWSDLLVVWTSIGVAFLFVEWNGAGPELAWWNAVKERFTPRPKFHVLPKPRARSSGSRSESEDVYTSIDPILDKISKFGIGSLTASERRQLDRERERLLKKSE